MVWPGSHYSSVGGFGDASLSTETRQLWVKLRTQFEQMSSGLPLKADITRSNAGASLCAVITLPDTQLGAGTGHNLAETINEFGLGFS
jgi:hypothetical protein